MPPPTKSRTGRTATTLISTIGSIAAAAMVIRTLSREFLPPEFRDYMYLGFRNIINKFSTQLTMIIYEFEGFTDNEIYTATQLYLADRISSNIHRIKVTKVPSEQYINVAMELNEEYTDLYDGVKFSWSLVSKRTPTREFYSHDENGRSTRTDLRSLQLTFHWKHKDLALNNYLPYIINYAKTKKQNVKTLKLFTIAAMANYLNFDIYNLELSDVKSNSELRRLLVTTANRSILVVEDIDYSVELHDREKVEAEKGVARSSKYRSNDEERPKVTLSGFLNFIDGLWSSCGDERIIIFTSNRKEKLDPALIRPGRMDVHIHMSYCTPSGFRVLAANYLSITEHEHYEEIENLLSEVEVTPAEVAEQLLKDNNPDNALCGLIEFFDVKKRKLRP